MPNDFTTRRTDQILDLWAPMDTVEPDITAEIRESAAQTVMDEGAFAFRRSDPCSNVAIVGSGVLRVAALTDQGRELTLYRVGPGETCLLTLACVLGGHHYAGHAVAETPVEAVMLPAGRFRDWVDRSPTLRRYVFGFMAARTAELVDLIESLFLPLDRRLAGILLAGFRDTEHLDATHTDLAADVGSSREVVSRILKGFEEQGVLDLGRRQIDLRDRTRLESIYSNP